MGHYFECYSKAKEPCLSFKIIMCSTIHSVWLWKGNGKERRNRPQDPLLSLNLVKYVFVWAMGDYGW